MATALQQAEETRNAAQAEASRMATAKQAAEAELAEARNKLAGAEYRIKELESLFKQETERRIGADDRVRSIHRTRADVDGRLARLLADHHVAMDAADLGFADGAKERIGRGGLGVHGAITLLVQDLTAVRAKNEVLADYKVAVDRAHLLLDAAGVPPAGRCEDGECKTKLEHRIRDGLQSVGSMAAAVVERAHELLDRLGISREASEAWPAAPVTLLEARIQRLAVERSGDIENRLVRVCKQIAEIMNEAL